MANSIRITAKKAATITTWRKLCRDFEDQLNAQRYEDQLNAFEDQLNAHQGWEDFLGLEANTEFVRTSRVCHGATIIPKIFTGGLSEILW